MRLSAKLTEDRSSSHGGQILLTDTRETIQADTLLSKLAGIEAWRQ
jgi:hypothetical protein